MQLFRGLICRDRKEEVIGNLYHHAPFFDYQIVVDNGSRDGLTDFLKSETARDLKVVYVDGGPKYQTIRLRNLYLEAAKQLMASWDFNWMFRVDTDEYVNHHGGYQLREIATEATKAGVNILGVNVVDVVENIDGSTRFAETDFHSPKLYQLDPQTHYQGDLHEGIALGLPHNYSPVDTLLYYHVRNEASVWLRSCRNYFMCARTTACKEDCPGHADFKGICAQLGLEEFREVSDLLRAGDLPASLREWIVKNRGNENCEARAYFNVYYGLLHPEENDWFAGNKDLDFDKDRQPYKGRMTF